jgi:F0F1-type ATP synthase membrane subunit a
MRPLFLLSLLVPAFAFASEEGVNPKATDLFEIGGIPVSNSILTTWILAAVIIIALRVLVGTPKIVPSRGQALVENMASGLRNALEPIVGKSMIGKVFPTLCGFFVFILLMNWSGLLPGVGTIKYAPRMNDSTFIVAPGSGQESTIKTIKANKGIVIEQSSTGVKQGEVVQARIADFGVGFDEHSKDVAANSLLTKEQFEKLQKNSTLTFWEKFKEGYTWEAIRPATSDLNTTLALSIISFVAWTYFVLRYAGFKVLIFDLFGNKADKKELSTPMWIMLSFIFLGVGGIEVVSIAFRLISLSFRLYGNVFGGENLIHALGGIAPYVVPAVAGLLEVLVGLIQAFVFTLLSAVYIGLICNHEGGHDEEHAH